MLDPVLENQAFPWAKPTINAMRQGWTSASLSWQAERN
jgi:hypothetical protein